MKIEVTIDRTKKLPDGAIPVLGIDCQSICSKIPFSYISLPTYCFRDNKKLPIFVFCIFQH